MTRSSRTKRRPSDLSYKTRVETCKNTEFITNRIVGISEEIQNQIESLGNNLQTEHETETTEIDDNE
ncbi:hypothetical protein FQR65_LT13783 [Abscondita terminalis]|nr:hypothetical protein FQR65_LT13783 [Abscondita terminalis]